MPQEFHVLCCVECGTFQVHIVKKINKWTCKICQKKQSVLQEFARGNGKECRLVVQRLNERRLQQDLLPTSVSDHNCDPQVEFETGDSKWNKYLDEKEESAEEELDVDESIDNAGVATKRKCVQSSRVFAKQPARGDAKPPDGDLPERCVDVARPKIRTDKMRSSEQARGTDRASKWMKYVDPTEEDDDSTRGTLAADCDSGKFEEQEEDLDELLKF